MPNTYITEDDVRLFLLDRGPADNDLLKDLAHSVEEIQEAMDRAAREYNSIPPYVGRVTADCLPKDTNMFLDAVVQQIYISELNRMSRNDIDYDAGGVTTNLEAKRIAHLERLEDFHGRRFREAATYRKQHINLRDAYGPVG